MEEYMKERPRKTIFSKSEQKKIFEKVKNFVLNDLLPNPKINKIIMFGSLVKGTFGKYEKPFKHRMYSDIDILLLVENNFRVPKKWKLHISCKLYKVFNITKLDRKILIQYMVCRKKSYTNKKHQKEAEKWGAPLLLAKSKHKYVVIYDKFKKKKF